MEQMELEETRMIMQVAAEMLDVFFNGDEKEEVVKRKTGVVLLTFPFTEEEYADIQVNYISNWSRPKGNRLTPKEPDCTFGKSTRRNKMVRQEQGYQPKKTEHSPTKPPKAPDGMKTGGKPPSPSHKTPARKRRNKKKHPTVAVETTIDTTKQPRSSVAHRPNGYHLSLILSLGTLYVEIMKQNFMREAADYLERGEVDVAREVADMAFGIYGYKKRHYAISIAIAVATFFILEWLI